MTMCSTVHLISLPLLFIPPLRYVKQCETFLLDGRISCEMFASECLPTLLHLARDKVPNVRIAVAKMLKESVLGIGRSISRNVSIRVQFTVKVETFLSSPISFQNNWLCFIM